MTTLAGVAQQKPRARLLGLEFQGTSGTRNAITDVPGPDDPMAAG